ncbi:MAG: hypothetical protein R3Y21_02035 [Mycoplasmatota bacterium]
MFILDTVSCGGIDDIPALLPGVVSLVVTMIKIVVPILLIIFGMLDLGKAVIQQKEDDIKKAQKIFISRIIAAVLVFFVVAIVQLVFGLLASAGAEDEGISECIDCFISNNC